MTEPANRPENELSGEAPPLTVLYDGACPLCRREIGIYRGLRPNSPVCFADVNDSAQLRDYYSTVAAKVTWPNGPLDRCPQDQDYRDQRVIQSPIQARTA